MFWFSFASLLPFVLLCAAALANGVGGWAVLGLMTVGVFTFDQIDRLRMPANPNNNNGPNRLLWLLGAAHFGALALVVPLLAQMELGHALPVALAAGLVFGQISHPAAHEMIHHPNRRMRRLGRAMYGSLLLGHHASAHMRVHHVYVATKKDPNSAPRGEGFYRFFIRAWWQSFRAGYLAETAARARKSTPPGWASHPYVSHLLWAAACLAYAATSAGWPGIWALTFVCFHAQTQVFLADYVQHYGLRRRIDENGRPAPLGAAHSWNAPHWYSGAMMLNAPRHSHHHLAAQTRFDQLRLEPGVPTLPYALPVMAVIALYPPVWRRVMARRLNALTTKPGQ